MMDVDDEFWEIMAYNGYHVPLRPDEITYRVRIAWDSLAVALAIVAALIGLLIVAADKSSG